MLQPQEAKEDPPRYSIKSLIKEDSPHINNVFTHQFDPQTLADQEVEPNFRCERHFLISKQTFVYNNEETLLVLFRDVTEFQLLQEERQKVHMMKMLHATVSHDMMNPIQNIRQFADKLLVVAQKNDPEQMRKYHRLITDSSKLVSCRMKDLLIKT